jgi:hypothetical protein
MDDDFDEFLREQSEDPVFRFYYEAAQRRFWRKAHPFSVCKEVTTSLGDAIYVLAVSICWFWQNSNFRDQVWLVLALLVSLTSLYFIVDGLVNLW